MCITTEFNSRKDRVDLVEAALVDLVDDFYEAALNPTVSFAKYMKQFPTKS